MGKKRQPPKKKLSKKQRDEFARRSKAARKGWQTRRRRGLAEKGRKLTHDVAKSKKRVKQVLSALPPKKRKRVQKELTKRETVPEQPLEKIRYETATKKELLEHIRQLEDREKKLETDALFVRIMTEWVHIPGWTRQDGTTAMNYSSLRDLPEDKVNKLWNALDHAYEGGHLDVVAQEMAMIHDVQLREVYTLYFSR